MTQARLGFEVDSSQAKGASVNLDALVQASGRAEKASDNLSRTHDRAQRSTRSLADAVRQLTEAESRSGSVQSAQRARDIAHYAQELDRLRAKFNPVFAASKAYESSLNELNIAHRVGAINTNEYEQALAGLNRRFEMTTQGAMLAGEAMESAVVSSKMAQWNARNLSFQLIDIGQSLPMAFQSPLFALQSLGYQIAQIGQIYMDQGGMRQAMVDIVKQVTTFARYVGPAALVVGTLGAAFAGLTYEMNKTSSESITFLDAIVGTFGAIKDGVSNLIQPAVDLLGPMFSEAWTWIVNDFRDSGNWIINSTRATVEEVGILWEAAMTAIPEMASGVPTALEGVWETIRAGFMRMIALAQQGWAKFLHGLAAEAPDVDVPGMGNLRTYLGGAAISAGSAQYEAEMNAAQAAEQAAAKRAEGLKSISEGAKIISNALDEAAASTQRIMQEDPMGTAFSAIQERAEERARERRLEEEEKNKKKSGKSDAEREAERLRKAAERERKRLEEAYADMVRSGEEFIEMQELEQRVIGMTAEEANRLRYELDFLNEAHREGIELTPEQRNRLEELAATMASTEQVTRELQDRFDFTKDTFGGFFSDFKSGMEEGEGIWNSFANAATNAIDKVVDRMMNHLLDAIFEVNSASGGGGGLGGIFGSVLGAFGFGGGGGRGVSFSTSGGAPSPINFAGGFANGGTIPAGGFGVVGERGRELVRGPARVHSNRETEAMMGTVVNVYAPPGSDVREERSQSGGMEHIDVYIDQAVARHLQTPGSRSQKSMSTMGVKPMTTHR